MRLNYLQSTTTPGQATGDLTYDANGGTGEVIADAAMSEWCTWFASLIQPVSNTCCNRFPRSTRSMAATSGWSVQDANNNRDLIVCCERQMVCPARLLIYGINFNEMPNLSPFGQIIMWQMIDYLLMTAKSVFSAVIMTKRSIRGWYNRFRRLRFPHWPFRCKRTAGAASTTTGIGRTTQSTGTSGSGRRGAAGRASAHWTSRTYCFAYPDGILRRLVCNNVLLATE